VLVQLTLVLGANVLDLGVQGQLSTISANLATKPTLAQIEASTVLAKEATVNTRATQTSVNALPAAVLAAQVETGATVLQSLRLSNAVLGGKASGGGTGFETFRDLADTADRVVAEVDASGNRMAITRSL